MAHGDERHRPADELVEEGEKLMVGHFDADQPGPLVVVPFVDGGMPCGDDRFTPYYLPLGDDAFVTFLHNESSIEASFRFPAQAQRFVGIGIDTGEAVRALFVMQEHVVAIHTFAGAALKDGNVTFREGELGVAHAAGPSAHGVAHPLEGEGMVAAYHDLGVSTLCEHDRETMGFRANKTMFAERAEPGRIVHVVVLYDPAFDVFLPRPIDNSTIVFQANLYLARPGEDLAALRAAFDPKPRADVLVPLLLVATTLPWAVFAGVRQQRR